MNLANAGAALLGAIVRSYDGTANENQPPISINFKRALVSALIGFTDREIP